MLVCLLPLRMRFYGKASSWVDSTVVDSRKWNGRHVWGVSDHCMVRIQSYMQRLLKISRLHILKKLVLIQRRYLSKNSWVQWIFSCVTNRRKWDQVNLRKPRRQCESGDGSTLKRYKHWKSKRLFGRKAGMTVIPCCTTTTPQFFSLLLTVYTVPLVSRRILHFQRTQSIILTSLSRLHWRMNLGFRFTRISSCGSRGQSRHRSMTSLFSEANWRTRYQVAREQLATMDIVASLMLSVHQALGTQGSYGASRVELEHVMSLSMAESKTSSVFPSDSVMVYTSIKFASRPSASLCNTNWRMDHLYLMFKVVVKWEY